MPIFFLYPCFYPSRLKLCSSAFRSSFSALCVSRFIRRYPPFEFPAAPVPGRAVRADIDFLSDVSPRGHCVSAAAGTPRGIFMLI